MLMADDELASYGCNTESVLEVISKITSIAIEAADLAYDNGDYKVYGLCRGVVKEMNSVRDKIEYINDSINILIKHK